MAISKWSAWYIPNTGKWTLFLLTLDRSVSILRPKQSMNFIHSVPFTIKMGSEFPLFGATRFVVIKIYPAVIVLSRKRCEMLPSLSPSILYHHILSLSRLWKKFESALRNLWHPGYGKNISVAVPLLTWPTQVSILFGVGKGTQIYKNWTSNGDNNWWWCC